jgi:hypothetical protein
MVSFTLRTLHPWGKSPRYPLSVRLDGPQLWSGCGSEERNLYPSRQSDPIRPARLSAEYDILVPLNCVPLSLHETNMTQAFLFCR